MTVKVGQEGSKPRAINAGVPQGSVLGCYLFNIAVDDLEEGFAQTAEIGEQNEHLTRSNDFPASSTPSRVGLPAADIGVFPIGQPQGFVLLARIANIPPWIKAKNEKKWTEKQVLSVKFVDDGINAETVNMKEVPLMLDGTHKFKETTAKNTTDLLDHIRVNTAKKGMLVNEKKNRLNVCLIS